MSRATRHSASRKGRRPAWHLVAAVVIAAGVRVMAAEPDDLPAPVFREGFSYKGAELCVRCHRSEQSAWCDTATSTAWRHDAHSRSHLALLSTNPRTRSMEEALGIKAAETTSCKACHTHPDAEPGPEEEIPEAENRFFHTGISCETCHGAGSSYLEPHLHTSWRFLSSAEKASHGMVDLRNPALKAENCLACHMGDAGTGRVVPHAAYAAGHPPLGAFEMEAASAALGPHWKRVWEKSDRIQELAADKGYQVEAASTAHRSLIGALVALRESALLVQKAAGPATARETLPSWPELSLYDCQACHHDLVLPSRRQQAGYGGLVPGRPGLVRWPRRLAEVAFSTAEMPTAADDILSPWVTSLNARPFGHRDDLRAPPGAGNALARVDAAIAALATVRRDASLPERQRQIAETLAAAGPRSGDLDSARPVAWVLADVIQTAPGWTATDRAAVRARLETALDLRMPRPAEATAAAIPFWRTSLDAAAAYDPALAAEAFRLPPPQTPAPLPPR
jgi:hypothetical protein